MQALPHHYLVGATGGSEGSVTVTGPGLPDLSIAAPAEFDGPGDLWSPETLLAGAVASCLILTFRSIATASKLEWNELSCDTTATLDRVDSERYFTGVRLKARLTIPAGGDLQRAERLVRKAEQVCLVSSSLRAERGIEVEVVEAVEA